MRRRQPDMRPWRVSLRCRVNSRPISASSSTTIWTRSKASGAVSKTSPTAPHSKVLIGSPRGTGTSAGPTACGPSSSSAPMRMARPRSFCRLPSRRSLASSGCAGSARSSATTTRRYWRAIFRSALRPSASSPPGATCANKCSATRGCATIGSSWRRCRKWSAPRPIRSSSLDVTANASGAHLTQLGDDWEKFYFAKRSSATRRRDRAKRRHMSEYGEIRFVTATEIDDARRTLETLIDQKHRAFARRGIRRYFCAAGIARILSRPGV